MSKIRPTIPPIIESRPQTDEGETGVKKPEEEGFIEKSSTVPPKKTRRLRISDPWKNIVVGHEAGYDYPEEGW